MQTDLQSTRTTVWPAKQSKILWGFDYQSLYPNGALINERVLLKACDFSAIQQFLKDHPEQIKSDTQSEFLFAASSQEKQIFHSLYSDCFQLIDVATGNIIGINLNNVLDWHTYYIRYLGFVKNYRGGGIYADWDQFFFGLLKDFGVQRIECDVTPGNQIQNYNLTKHGFIPTGTRLSERWGAQTIFTKFLSPSALAVFRQQFCPLDNSNLQVK